MHVLVTGGNGFIGSHVCDRLRAQGITVVSFDRYRRPLWRDDIEQFTGDVRDREAVFDAVANTDGVIHLAGLLGTAETVGAARNAVEVNVLGSLNVFDAVAHHGKRCVNIAVGNVTWLSSYPITKFAAERLALMYNREFGTKIAVVRGLNVYGERQKHKPVRKVVPNFIRQALLGQPITVYGDGQQIVDLIYAPDCAELLVRALLLDHGCYDTVMEAGMGLRVTAADLAAAVWQAVYPGQAPQIAYVPMRPGEPVRSVTLGDPSTLAPLGWTHEDFTSLQDGLASTVRWYQEHRSFIDC